MDNVLCSLSDEEVRRIFQLIEALDRQSFDFLQFEVGDLKLALGKDNVPTIPVAEPQRPVAPSKPPSRAAEDTGAREGTVTIAAALLGRFHAQPEPGAAPFVVVGSEVTEDTTIGLIEVIRTFNAAKSGVSGVITEICVQNAQFVEFGQILFRVRPVPAA